MLTPDARVSWSRWLALAAAASLLVSGCHRNRDLVGDNLELYRMAQQNIADRRFMEAVRVLGDIGLITPISDDLDPKIKLALADAHFYQPGTVSVVEAQSRYEQFIAFYPLHESAEYARYQVGVCLLRQAESPENDQEYSVRATQHFQQMALELPESSPWRRAARLMLIKAQENLAEHEWLVAEHYLKHEKWKGAIARLSNLVEKFEGAARREEAFYELARALAASGELARASATVEVMLSEYPNGSWSSAARQLGEEIASRPADPATPPAGDGPAVAP